VVKVAPDEVVEARNRLGLGNRCFEIIESRKVDATISDDIKTKALTSVASHLLFMFIYIACASATGNTAWERILSLSHDVLSSCLGLYSLLWGIVGFSMEIDEAFIAVILTVIGYSINDTVVVFDRIREYMHRPQT
jgi:SecD/SecF fusion protein